MLTTAGTLWLLGVLLVVLAMVFLPIVIAVRRRIRDKRLVAMLTVFGVSILPAAGLVEAWVIACERCHSKRRVVSPPAQPGPSAVRLRSRT